MIIQFEALEANLPSFKALPQPSQTVVWTLTEFCQIEPAQEVAQEVVTDVLWLLQR